MNDKIRMKLKNLDLDHYPISISPEVTSQSNSMRNLIKMIEFSYPSLLSCRTNVAVCMNPLPYSATGNAIK